MKKEKNMTNTITFDFDYNHNIFETLAPYYSHITNIIYNTNNKAIGGQGVFNDCNM